MISPEWCRIMAAYNSEMNRRLYAAADGLDASTRQADGGAFTQELDLFTSYYFTVTVLGTVGFGDITPVTVPARSVAMIQMVIDIGFVAVTVRLLTREVRISGAKRSSDTSPS